VCAMTAVEKQPVTTATLFLLLAPLPPYCFSHEPVSGPAVDEVEKDNRDLVDHNTSQALTADDIEAMKASGKVSRHTTQHNTTHQGVRGPGICIRASCQ